MQSETSYSQIPAAPIRVPANNPRADLSVKNLGFALCQGILAGAIGQAILNAAHVDKLPTIDTAIGATFIGTAFLGLVLSAASYYWIGNYINPMAAVPTNLKEVAIFTTLDVAYKAFLTSIASLIGAAVLSAPIDTTVAAGATGAVVLDSSWALLKWCCTKPEQEAPHIPTHHQP